MINEFDCKLCKKHFRVNGILRARHIQREHMNLNHKKEYENLLKEQDIVEKNINIEKEKLRKNENIRSK